MTRHPIQPLALDERGVLRFKANAVVPGGRRGAVNPPWPEGLSTARGVALFLACVVAGASVCGGMLAEGRDSELATRRYARAAALFGFALVILS